MEDDASWYAKQAALWRRVSPGRPASAPKPKKGQESVWDYPRPPALEPVAQVVRVEFAGRVIARTDAAYRVLETASPPTFYLPPEALSPGLQLLAEEQTSACEWKGVARYWSLRVGDQVARAAAWSYPTPRPAFGAIANYLAFYPSRVDGCYVADERVTPQPSDFYGGWVTSRIVGPFKGEPGTGHW